MFTDIDIPTEYFDDCLRRQAVANAGVSFRLRLEKPGGGFETREYLYANGIVDYVKELAGESPLTQPRFIQAERKGRDREDKEEYRLKQREKEGLSLAIKGIVISLMYGNTIMALTLGLVTFLYTGYREGTIEATQDAQRNAREELAAIKEQYYYNNPFSQQKEEEQQVRRGGGFRR